MNQKTHSQKFLRQRKFLLVLPLLVLPFITLMFWALGGGKSDNQDITNSSQGFNMQLPGANVGEDKPLDKLSYYEKATSDSVRLEQLLKNDPYYRLSPDTEVISTQFIDTFRLGGKYNSAYGSLATSTPKKYTDTNEAKVYSKLAQLKEALNKSANSGATGPDLQNSTQFKRPPVNSEDVDRLEQMMNTMNQKEGGDPEIEKLSSMLEKVLDIQHPDRVKERIKLNSEIKKGQVFPVVTNYNDDAISLLGNHEIEKPRSDTSVSGVRTQNRFFSFEDSVDFKNSQNTVEAVIHETQTLVNGSTVKLRLLNDVYINGVLIPKNSFAFGIAQLNGERLAITINSIRYLNLLFPVELQVYDMDGLNGIYIPGAISRDVTKESADRSMQGIGYTTLDPSIGAQAAGAGIEAVKTLLTKKVKLIRVTLKAEYKVLLKSENTNQ